MKAAKKRHRIFTQNRQRPLYRLADLMAQCQPGLMELGDEMQAWENMVPVGREFGADPVDQLRQFMQDQMSTPAPGINIRKLIDEGRH